jgi:hypothetical protein
MLTAQVAEHYPSLESFLQFVETPSGHAGSDKIAEGDLNANDPNVPSAASGVERGIGWATLRARFRTSTPALVERLRQEIAQIDLPALRSVRRRGTWRDSGDELNRDRLYAGYTDSWRTAVRQNIETQTHVRLVAEIGANASATVDSLFYSGAATAALAEALCSAGYEVEVLAAHRAERILQDRGEGSFAAFSVTVKPYESPLTLSTLTATIADGTFFRTAGFAWGDRAIGRLNLQVDPYGGQSKPILPTDLPPVGTNVRTIIIPRVLNATDANAAIKNALENLHIDTATESNPAPVTARPPAPPKPAPVSQTQALVKGATIQYKGQEWRIGYVGPTKFGPRAKLERAGEKPVWVPTRDGKLA